MNELEKILDFNSVAEENNLSEAGEVYLLYSFDLVNSTKYKSISKEWPEVFEIFYRETGTEMSEKIGGIVPWKYIGDEILFAKKIISENDVLDACKNVDKVRTNVLKKLHDTYKCTKGILEIKCVVWLTRAIKKSKGKDWLSGEEAIVLKNTEDTGNLKTTLKIDFLGKDIDCGFRLGKFVEHGKTVVGAKFCYCLLNLFSKLDKQKVPVQRYEELEQMIDKNFIIVSYKTLKGIWNENPYPVVWYHPNLDNPKKAFKYSDHLRSEMVMGFLNDYQNNKFTQDFYKLDYIKDLMEEHNLTEEMCLIEELIEKQISEYEEEEEKEKNEKSYSYQQKPRFEVHNSIAFVNNRRQVLIFKRSTNKNIQKNKWEFGSVFLKHGEDMYNSIKESYEEKYKIKKEMITNLKPISQFFITDQSICGFIYSSLVNTSELKRVLDKKTKDYSSYKIISINHLLNEVEKFPDDYVPNFKRDLVILKESLK